MTQKAVEARDFVETAAVVASQCGPIIRGCSRLSQSSAEAYWVASRCRIERWAHAIKRFQQRLERRDASDVRWAWSAFRPWYDEILISEILTRVWTATAIACDDCPNPDPELQPIVRSVMLGHMEARQRILRLLVNETDLPKQMALDLNRLRRNAERWTDVLLGYLHLECDVSEFAFDVTRVSDFADGLRFECQQSWEHYTWPMLVSSLRSHFRAETVPVLPNADLNETILCSILGAFPSDMLDATGQFHSLWQCRLNHLATDAETLISQLLLEHEPASLRRGTR